MNHEINIDKNFSSASSSPAFCLSPEAWSKAEELRRDFPRYQGLSLRLYIEGKGCDGFTYGVTFDSPEPDDLLFEQQGLSCIIDPQSLIFCRGAVIEWVDDATGTGFLVNNPQQRHFRGKFYKRKAWVERLEGQKPRSITPPNPDGYG